MFRKMRRFKQQLSLAECEKLLANEKRGVLSVFGEDGYPYGFPMDFLFDDGKIYFHCAKVGHKIDAIKANNKVSFCIMDSGFKKENEWALNIKSVIVFGRINILTDEQKIENQVRKLGIKYYPTPESVEVEMKKALNAVCCLELSIDHISGKLANE